MLLNPVPRLSYLSVNQYFKDMILKKMRQVFFCTVKHIFDLYTFYIVYKEEIQTEIFVTYKKIVHPKIAFAFND